MPSYGKRSLKLREQLHPDVAIVLDDAIRIVDFTIISAYRGRELQNRLYREGKSKLKYPQSLHNTKPAEAVDIAPYPKLYSAPPREFCYVAGVIMACAEARGIELRWGGDWDMDDDTEDQTFMDWGHFEKRRG